jgi:hypothetical protein
VAHDLSSTCRASTLARGLRYRRFVKARTVGTIGSAIGSTTLAAVCLVACDTTIETTPVAIDCGEYLDGEAEKAVEVVIENHTDDFIYFGSTGCESTPRFRLYEDGEHVDLLEGPCAWSCADLQESSGLACTADCAVPDVIAIAPGGSYAMTWSGLVGRNATMPASCYADPESAQTTCPMLVPAPQKTFEVGALLFATVGCFAGDCCEPNDEGHCVVSGFSASPNGEGHEVRASFVHPQADSVTIAVTGSVGCPAAPPANGSPCLVEVASCDYLETDPCGHSIDPTASCEQGNWVVGGNAVLCDKTCPAEAPEENASCDEAADGSHCPYSVGTCYAVMGCSTTDGWQILDQICSE